MKTIRIGIFFAALLAGALALYGLISLGEAEMRIVSCAILIGALIAGVVSHRRMPGMRTPAIGACLCLLMIGGMNSAKAVELASWNTEHTGTQSDDAVPAVTPGTPGVSADPITIGSGINLYDSTTTDNTISATAWTTGDVAGGNDYFQFSVHPTDARFSLAILSFAHKRNANGPTKFLVRASKSSSFTGANFIEFPEVAVLTDNVTDYSVDLNTGKDSTGANAPNFFDGFSGKIYFRVHAYAAVSGGGIWSIKNHSTNGKISVTACVNLGTFLSEDGSLSFGGDNIVPTGNTATDRNKSEDNLREKIGQIDTDAIGTLVYSVAVGSQVMSYPTTVSTASRWNWRTISGIDSVNPWSWRMPWNNLGAANDWDAVQVAGAEAKSMGLYFMPAYRMNDVHFVHNPIPRPCDPEEPYETFAPEGNPLTGQFWMENHGPAPATDYTLMTKAVPPVDDPVDPADDDIIYRRLFDYSHVEVRDHITNILFEVIDRYTDTVPANDRDIMDGIQLDFMRQPLFFPYLDPANPANATALEGNRALMAGLVSAVRGRLDSRGDAVGRYLPLCVRVPADLDTCRNAGLAVDEWIDDGLVDIVVVAPSIKMSYDLPAVKQLADLPASRPVAIYASILDEIQYHWPFEATGFANPSSTDVEDQGTQEVEAPHARAAIINALTKGAANIELYNFRLPLPNAASPGLRENPELDAAVAAINDLGGGDRIYAITPKFWEWREPFFEYVKPSPAIKTKDGGGTIITTGDGEQTFQLYIGEESFGSFAVTSLRIGLRSIDLAGDEADCPVTIKINGDVVYGGAIRTKLEVMPARDPAKPRCNAGSPPPPNYRWGVLISGNDVDAAQVYLRIDGIGSSLNGLDGLNGDGTGVNDISVQFGTHPSTSTTVSARLVEVAVGLFVAVP